MLAGAMRRGVVIPGKAGFQQSAIKMKKASDYRQHAEECRALATTMEVGEHREQLLRMAETWEQLAKDRIALITRHPELAQPGESLGDAFHPTQIADAERPGSGARIGGRQRSDPS